MARLRPTSSSGSGSRVGVGSSTGRERLAGARGPASAAWAGSKGVGRGAEGPPRPGRARAGGGGGREVPVGGDDDDRGVAGDLAEPAQGGEAVHPRQAHVEDNDIGTNLRGDIEGRLGGRGDADAVALSLERLAQGPGDGLF